MCTPRGREMATEDSTEDWNSTANMLWSVLGQVERRLAQSQASPSGSVARGAVQQTSSNSSNPARATQQPSGQQSSSRPRMEFDKLFGYKPDVSASGGRKRTRKSNRSQAAPKRSNVKVWKKQAICLRYKGQTKGPDTAEKMALAKVGLGLKELEFNTEGDAMHVHNVLQEAFPSLSECGGYTLHRLATNSTDLIQIEAPRGGLRVKYLKDIIKSAKLYIRPLQADIVDDSNHEVRV